MMRPFRSDDDDYFPSACCRWPYSFISWWKQSERFSLWFIHLSAGKQQHDLSLFLFWLLPSSLLCQCRALPPQAPLCGVQVITEKLWRPPQAKLNQLKNNERPWNYRAGNKHPSSKISSVAASLNVTDRNMMFSWCMNEPDWKQLHTSWCFIVDFLSCPLIFNAMVSPHQTNMIGDNNELCLSLSL